MTKKTKNFSRLGDGSRIQVVGAPDTQTASELGDLFSAAFGGAYALAKAEIVFNRFTPKIQELIERDLPGTFAEKQNVFSVIGAAFKAEHAKSLLLHAKKEITDKIERDKKEAMMKCGPLTDEQAIFAGRIVQAALAACDKPDVISPQ